jgi:hypothetical protein
MKIGPKGYEFYGPNVPDIYIFGGYIFGKDVSWSGINFAYKFQLVCVFLFLLIAFLCYVRSEKRAFVQVFQWIQSLFLLFFPVWMWMYTGGVVNNSDGADLTVYPHLGWIMYLALVYLQIRIFTNSRKVYQVNPHGI